MAATPSVLLLGDRDVPEFGAAVRWLNTHTRLTEFATLREALEHSECEQEFWDHVVIAQARPGQYTQADVDCLGRSQPLARLVALLGSCCEGEPRSGRPWPGVIRIYWHQWSARAASVLGLEGTASRWQVPRTASEVERIDHALRTPPRTAAERLAVIWTPHHAFFAGVSAACHLVGYDCVWAAARHGRSPADVAVALWHSPEVDDRAWGQLRRFATRWPQVPLIALLGFPRYDQVERAAACGAGAVVSIPFLLPDLWNTLQELTS